MADNRTGKLYEEIAAQMMEQIRSGALRPGDRLPPERTLAEEYGVSRTAIREALRSMEMMGCVESHVGEGTYIKTPSLQEIVDPFSMLIAQNGRMGGDLIEARLILETEIAALAARRRTDEQLSALEKTLAEMRRDIESGGMGIEADERFHEISGGRGGQRGAEHDAEYVRGNAVAHTTAYTIDQGRSEDGAEGSYGDFRSGSDSGRAHSAATDARTSEPGAEEFGPFAKEISESVRL